MTTRNYVTRLRDLDETAFEEWLCGYIQEVYEVMDPPQRNGGRGHEQHGVDVFVRLPHGDMLGVQAKAYIKTQLTSTLLGKEIADAHEFKPALQRYVVCTLNDRKPQLQEQTRSATMHGSHTVTLLSVDDLAEQMARLPKARADLVRRTTDTSELATVMEVFGDDVRRMMAPLLPEAAPTNDKKLRAIDDWIDAGQPQRALDELAAYAGALDTSMRRRLRMRAYLSLGNPNAVVDLAREETNDARPSATVLAYGAHAAQLAGDATTAESFLNRAIDHATEADRPEVLACYLRVHAYRGDADFARLEAYARSYLSDIKPVALALADSAFQLGEMEAANRWYRFAHENRPLWPIGAQINAAGAETWQLIQALTQNAQPVEQQLEAVASRLAILVEQSQSLQARSLHAVALVNLGHVYRVLDKYAEAAKAWDRALLQSDMHETLWIHRCVLCANLGTQLPSDELVGHWAITPLARLAFASACISLGDTSQARTMLDEVLADASLSDNDRAIASIESIRLRHATNDDSIVDADFEAMLQLFDAGNRSPPLLGWLCEHAKLAGSAQQGRVRQTVEVLARFVDLDLERRLVYTDALLRAGYLDVAFSWLPMLRNAAVSDSGDIMNVAVASLLLRLYIVTFHFDDARKLIGKLRTQQPSSAALVLRCASAFEQMGDRLSAYELLDDTIREGQRSGMVLLSWAHVAVILKRRREANALMRTLAITPESADDYAQVLQARAWLGVHGHDQELLEKGVSITPETASSVFGASLIRRGRRQPRVAFGRVVHLRITKGGHTSFDKRVLLTEKKSDVPLPGVEVLNVHDYPWIRDLLGARTDEHRMLTAEPFGDQMATIVDVIEVDRWSVQQAAEMVQRLPTTTTGVQAVQGDPAALMQSIGERLKSDQVARHQVLQTAAQGQSSIELAAGVLHVSPRSLLHASNVWAPVGYMCQFSEIYNDDRTLLSGKRVVLDAVSVLLLVEAGADDLVAKMPQRPIITRQTAQQLFDWWYAFERPRPGVAAHIALTEHESIAIALLTAKHRRDVLAYWSRVKQLIENHVELMDPPAITDSIQLRMSSILSPSTVGSMALAARNDWTFLAEEYMPRVVATVQFHANVASVHRLIAVGASQRWMTTRRAALAVATLVQMGWQSVTFPYTYLFAALRISGTKRWPTFVILAGRFRDAAPTVAIPALFTLLEQVDKGKFPLANARRVRDMVSTSLPIVPNVQERRAWAMKFEREHQAKVHSSSRKCVWAWASGSQ